MSMTIDGVVTNKFELKQKEGKRLKFTYSESLSGASFSLIIVDSSGETVISKSDSDFDKTSILTNIVYVNLDVDDLDLDIGTYLCELKVTWDAETTVDKTITFKMKIRESLHT